MYKSKNIVTMAMTYVCLWWVKRGIVLIIISMFINIILLWSALLLACISNSSYYIHILLLCIIFKNSSSALEQLSWALTSRVLTKLRAHYIWVLTLWGFFPFFHKIGKYGLRIICDYKFGFLFRYFIFINGIYLLYKLS